jgi:hypothetical protein
MYTFRTFGETGTGTGARLLPSSAVPRYHGLEMERPLLASLVVFLAVSAVTPVGGGVTDRDGFITSANWLVLGPFRQANGCGRSDAELLGNFIAPAAIPCEYPAAGDEIDYDPFLADSFDYAGPPGDNFLPVWRPLDGGEDDAVLDLGGDAAFECLGGDGEECGGSEYCEYRASARASMPLKTPTAIRCGPGASSAMSLALGRGGQALIDDPVAFPEWVFHGAVPPPGRLSCGDGSPRFIRGDCNGDGRVTGSVADAVFLLNHSFGAGPAPGCLAACDSNGDGDVLGNVSDAIYVLSFNFFANGRPPPPPFPACGTSGRAGDLDLGCAKSPPACGG